MNRNRNLWNKKYGEVHVQPHRSRFNATKKKGHGSHRSKEEIAEYVAIINKIKEGAENEQRG